MPSSLLEEAGLCGDTFDGVETVVGDFCKKERKNSFRTEKL